MASFGGIELSTGGAGVFELTSVSDDEKFEYRFDNGSEAIIPPSSKVVVVRKCPGVDFEEIHNNARKAANQALDVYFCQGGRPLIMAHKDSPFVVSWTAQKGQVLRIVGRNQVTSRGRAQGRAYDIDGNVIDQPPPLPKVWFESLRYYRVSESSTDLFDSFRNLYLGLEALLSHVVPPEERKANGKPEGDSDWLCRALGVIRHEIDLAAYAPESPKAPHNAIHEELYGSLRTAIFHAKTGRRAWLPQDWSDRAVILGARFRYAQMFRALAAAYMKASYPSGGLTKKALEMMIEEGLRDNEVFVSNDRTSVDDESRGNYQLSPAGGAFLKLPTEAALGEVYRFGTLLKGEPAIVESLQAPLVVDGTEELQVILLIEARNYAAPRQDFES